jgi:hypothetical protein
VAHVRFENMWRTDGSHFVVLLVAVSFSCLVLWFAQRVDQFVGRMLEPEIME